MQWPPDIATSPSNTTVHLKRGWTNTPTSPGNRTPPLLKLNKRQTDKRRIASRRCLVRLTLLNDNSTNTTRKTLRQPDKTKPARPSTRVKRDQKKATRQPTHPTPRRWLTQEKRPGHASTTHNENLNMNDQVPLTTPEKLKN